MIVPYHSSQSSGESTACRKYLTFIGALEQQHDQMQLKLVAAAGVAVVAAAAILYATRVCKADRGEVYSI